VCATVPWSSLGYDDLSEDFPKGLLRLSVHSFAALHWNDLEEEGEEPRPWVNDNTEAGDSSEARA
jgi:hypothetical protein